MARPEDETHAAWGVVRAARRLAMLLPSRREPFTRLERRLTSWERVRGKIDIPDTSFRVGSATHPIGSLSAEYIEALVLSISHLDAVTHKRKHDDHVRAIVAEVVKPIAKKRGNR